MATSAPAPIPAPPAPPKPLVETYAPAPVPVPPPTEQRPEVFRPGPQPAPPPEPDYPQTYEPPAPADPIVFIEGKSIPYAVAILDEGEVITPKVTQINFIGAIVTATADGSIVAVQVNPEDVATVTAGTSIEVTPTLTANGTNYQITNTFTETVASLGTVSGNVVPNRNNGTIQKMTLTGPINLQTPTNMSAGQSLTLILTQDSTGNRYLTAASGYIFAEGYTELSVAGNSIDILNIFTDGIYYYTTLTTGYTA